MATFTTLARTLLVAPAFRANHGSLADGAATSQELLAGVLVALLAAHVGLINLHRPPKQPSRLLDAAFLSLCAKCQADFWVISRSENGGDKLVHGSGGISQPRAE